MEKTFENSVGAMCGDGKLSGDGGAEYPFVTRLRHRRLFTFLWLQGFKATCESMLGESDAVLSVPRLQELVERGQWRYAIRYLSRFLPPPMDTKRRPLSVEAEVLHRFLGVHMALSCIVAGGGTEECPGYMKDISPGGTVCPGATRLRSIILSILVYARHQVRDSIDWERVRCKASDIVHDLAYQTPELKDFIYMPISLIKPHNVLPIGFGFRRRFHSKKQIRRPSALVLAKVYFGQQRSLPAISVPSQESCDELSVPKALDWVADIVDECLKAGKRPQFHPVLPLQTRVTEVKNAGSRFTSHVPTNGTPFLGTMCTPVSQTVFGSLTSFCGNSGVGLMANAGAPVAPVSQTMTLANHAESSGAIAAPVSRTMFGSLTHPSINPAMLSVANAGKLGNHVPTRGAPFLGNMRPPVSHTVFGSLASCFGNSSVGLMANAGTAISPVSQMMNLTSHARDSGALRVAPVSQNMFGTLTSPAPTTGMPLVANAGQSAGLALTPGAPYLVTLFNAPVSLTAVGCLTGIAKNSGHSPMTNNSGAPVSPAMQVTNLARQSGNSGAPVVPAVQTTNLASCAENSVIVNEFYSSEGINKRLDKEGGSISSAGSAHNILDASKNPRKEPSILDEQDPHPIKQQMTDAFGEASLMPAVQT